MPDIWATKSLVPIPEVVAATFHKNCDTSKARLCIYSVNSCLSLIFVPCVEMETIPFVLRRVETKKCFSGKVLTFARDFVQKDIKLLKIAPKTGKNNWIYKKAFSSLVVKTFVFAEREIYEKG
jgi:hypothetical protein